MRRFWTAVLIIGLFQPLVIHAQPFGDTDVAVFDVDFLSVPPGPPPETTEPPLPDWVAWMPKTETDAELPPILFPELPS